MNKLVSKTKIGINELNYMVTVLEYQNDNLLNALQNLVDAVQKDEGSLEEGANVFEAEQEAVELIERIRKG